MTVNMMLINLKAFKRLDHMEVKRLESVSKASVIQVKETELADC